MEILRVPPFPITVTWEVPEAETDYVLYFEDMADHSIISIPVTSTEDSKVIYEITKEQAKYDASFLVQIKDDAEVVLEDVIDLVRPYVDITTLTASPSELAEYKMYEVVTRSIIDSVVEGGFYNKKKVIQKSGDGSDYFPLWNRTSKVFKVYENDVLVYDESSEDPALNTYTYKVTLDNSAIYRVNTETFATPEGYNRAENMPIQLPRAYGDLVHGGYRLVAFPKGYDYIFVVEEGYKTLPSDVEKAALILFNDLKCGKMDYYQKFINRYKTQQYEVYMDAKMFQGTGNLIVDKILDNYLINIPKPGVL